MEIRFMAHLSLYYFKGLTKKEVLDKIKEPLLKNSSKEVDLRGIFINNPENKDEGYKVIITVTGRYTDCTQTTINKSLVENFQEAIEEKLNLWVLEIGLKNITTDLVSFDDWEIIL